MRMHRVARPSAPTLMILPNFLQVPYVAGVDKHRRQDNRCDTRIDVGYTAPIKPIVVAAV